MARLIQHMAGRIFFICGCFIGSLTYAQQNAIDSLETALKTVVEDTIRVKILVNLSDVYLAFQPDKSRSYAEEAVELSKKLDYPRGEGMALSHLGDYQFRQGKYAKAVEFASQSLHIAEKMQDSVLMAEAYRVLGNINNIGLKRYDSALAYQLKALHIHQRQKNYENIASICGSITWIYATTNQNLKEAHKLADFGIHLSDSLKNHRYLSYNYNSKGLIYKQEGQLDSALKYIDLSIKEAEKTKDRTVISYNNRIKGSLYLLKGDYQKAIALYKIALEVSRTLHIREVTKNSYGGLAKSYEGLGDFS